MIKGELKVLSCVNGEKVGRLHTAPNVITRTTKSYIIEQFGKTKEEEFTK